MNVFNRGTPHPTPPKCVPNDFAPRRRSPASRWSKRVKRNSDKQFVMIAALKASGVRQLGTVRLLVLEGSVELFGEVDSYYLKQLAQESIRQTAIGLRIVNQIRVTETDSPKPSIAAPKSTSRRQRQWRPVRMAK